MKRALVVLTSILLGTEARAATITVPVDFETISAAVAAANDGDVIVVQSGTYEERVRVEDVSDLEIRGTDAGAGLPVVRPPDDDDNAFRFRNTDNALITGFRIEGGRRGVRVDESNGVEIVDNEIDGSATGIRIHDGSGHIVLGNVISDTANGPGIRVRDTQGLQIDQNTVTGANGHGIRVRHSEDVAITDNETSDNAADGVRVIESAGVVVGNEELGGNTSSGNDGSGFRVKRSKEVSLAGNEADDNGVFGFRLIKSAPIDEAEDLVAGNNTAECNGRADLLVNRDRVTNDCGTTTSSTTTTTTTTTTTNGAP